MNAYLGRAVTAKRLALGMSLHDFARAAGYSYPHIASIEAGKKDPSGRALTAIALTLQISPAELLRYAETLATTGDRASDLAARVTARVIGLIDKALPDIIADEMGRLR